MTTANAEVIKICSGCDRRLLEASTAVRRHESQMKAVIELVRRGDLTEEARQEFKARLVASFEDAQSMWDAYRAHLIEHGILPE